MSARDSSARTGGTPMEVLLGQLGRGLGGLARRVQRLEEARGGSMPDLRFDIETDDDGAMFLVVERVSTGNRERITGPL